MAPSVRHVLHGRLNLTASGRPFRLPRKFFALLPIKDFRNNNEINQEAIDRFIRSLEDMTVKQVYGGVLITHHINQGTDLMEALKLMRSKQAKRIAVTDENGEFIGLLTESSIEKRIVDDVLSAKENS